MEPKSLGAYQLLHDGCVALAHVEAAGMPVDLEYCRKASKMTLRRAKRLEHQIMESETGKLWKRIYGPKLNFNSPNQMRHIFFNILKLEPVGYTETGRPSLDANALDIMQQRYTLPFVQKFIRMKRLLKAESTYLRNLTKEAVDGIVHPFFNLHNVQTFRSSSNAPNFQNLAIRDPEMGELIRSAIRAPEGHRIIEIDYGALEVKVAACYHRDKTMIEYIKDESKDMHRDSASDAYKLPPEEVSKMIRYVGKNMFVFPQFYGSYYIECARNMWDAVTRLDLTTTSGLPLMQHLNQMGITERGACEPGESPVPGTFEYHIQQVENIFWEERFKQYNRWRHEWVDQYRENGYFDTLTGFRLSGYYRRNEVINYPVQGSAFHCLLWSLIEMVKYIREKKMGSRVVCQIHDSLVAIVPDEEVQEYLDVAIDIMTEKLRKEWKWVIVPMVAEAEVSPSGGTWHEKKEWIKIDGKWKLPE